MSVQVNVAANGRMSLPIDVRRKLGLVGGGPVIIEETENGVVLRTVSQIVARAQALTREYSEGRPDISVAAFLAERRGDSGE